MKVRVLFFLSALCASVFYSCSSSDDGSISTYQVTRGDFRHVLRTEGYVESVSSTTILCPQRIDGILTYLVDDGTLVEPGDTLFVLDAAAVKTEYDNLIESIKTAEGELEKVISANKMQMALLQSQFLTNEAETKIAELDSLELKYMPPAQRRIKELELRKVAIERKKFVQKLRVTPIIQRTEERRARMNLERLKRRLETVEKMRSELVTLSPRRGLAIRSQSAYTGDKLKVGDNVWDGLPVIIIPNIDEFKVKIFASETDYKYINKDDSVLIFFGAMPLEQAFGKITSKAAAGNPIKKGSKVKMYEIEASIDSTTKKPDVGFTADCRIMIRELKDTLFVPLITVFSQDSIKVVFVKQKKGFEMRQVLTGLSSLQEVVITAGLNEGEQIAFTRPKESLVKKQTLLPRELVESLESEEEVTGNDPIPQGAPAAGSGPFDDEDMDDE